MELTPITRKEHFLAKAAGNPEAKDLNPITREEWFISKIQGGGSAEVTPASIVTATGQMDGTQKATTRTNLGAEPQRFVVNVTYSNSVYSADKTVAEIYAAYQAGKMPIAFIGSDVYTLVSIGDDPYAFFVNVDAVSGQYTVKVIHINDDDTINFYLHHGMPNVYERTGSTLTIFPVANAIYKCGTLTSLTITNPPATGAYSIVFTSGSTATTTTIPATILGLEDFSAEANTIYEINVLDNRAVVGSWAVST